MGTLILSRRYTGIFNEEADDSLLLFHVNHGVKMSNITKVVIGLPDTDIFVNAVFQFSVNFGLLVGKVDQQKCFQYMSLLTNLIPMLPISCLQFIQCKICAYKEVCIEFEILLVAGFVCGISNDCRNPND